MKNEHDNVINQLRKLSSFVQSKNFKTPEEMTKILKDMKNWNPEIKNGKAIQ